jgi:hypothetical protein
MERADFSNWRHKVWTRSRFQDIKPSDLVKRHFLHCFIDDRFGLRHLDEIGEDMVAYECDYPHSDSLWPEVPEHLWQSVRHLSDAQIDKITHANAVRFFRFDEMFRRFERKELTVAALRAQARARGVDTTPKSSGGARPDRGLAPVTSGDILRMFDAHAAARDVGAA